MHVSRKYTINLFFIIATNTLFFFDIWEFVNNVLEDEMPFDTYYYNEFLIRVWVLIILYIEKLNFKKSIFK